MNKLTGFLFVVLFMAVIFFAAIDINNRTAADNKASEIISRLTVMDKHLDIIVQSILMVYVKQEKL